MKRAIRDNDWEALQRAAHTLKGSVGNLGAAKAAEAAHRLEQLGKEGRSAEVPPAFESLQTMLKTLEEELNAFLKEKSNEGSHRR